MDFQEKQLIKMIFKNLKLINLIKIIKLHIILEIPHLMELQFTIHLIMYSIQKFMNKIIAQLIYYHKDLDNYLLENLTCIIHKKTDGFDYYINYVFIIIKTYYLIKTKFIF